MSTQLQSDNNQYQLPRFQGRQGKYYVVDGQKYDEHFPEEWALNHMSPRNCVGCPEDTGPKSCGNCRAYGSINGVFVFYCANCMNAYKGTRGGFIYCSLNTTEEELWKEFPYMDGITFDKIGDTTELTNYSIDTTDTTDYDEFEEIRSTSIRKLERRLKKLR